MSKGKKQKTTGTQTTTKQAPPWATGHMQSVMQQSNMYQPKVYGGQRVADLVPDQRMFFDKAKQYSNQVMRNEIEAPEFDTGALDRQMGRTTDTGGLLAALNQHTDTNFLKQLMGGRVNVSGLRDVANATTDVSRLEALTGMENAANDYLVDHTTREVTPYLAASVDDATDRALQGVSGLYASAGRLGSGSFADTAARGVTAAAAPILQQTALADANRQLSAAQSLGALSQADMARDVGLANYMTGYQSADLDRRGSLLGMIANLENSGLNRDAGIAGQIAGISAQDLARRQQGQAALIAARQADLARDAGLAGQVANLKAEQARLAPTVANMNHTNRMQALGLLGAVGDAQQLQRQAQLDAQRQMFADYNQAQAAMLQARMQAQGLAQGYTGSTTTLTEPQDNWGQTLGKGLLGMGTTILGAGMNNWLGLGK